MPQRQIRILGRQRRRRRRGTQAPFAGAPTCARASTSANAKDGGCVRVRARSDEGRGGAERAVVGFAEGRETVLVSDVAVGFVDVGAEEGAEPVADGGEALVAEEVLNHLSL